MLFLYVIRKGRSLTKKEIRFQIALGTFFFDDSSLWLEFRGRRLSCIHSRNLGTGYYYDSEEVGARDIAEQYIIGEYIKEINESKRN